MVPLYSKGGHTWVLRKPQVFSNRFEATARYGSLIQWKPNGHFVNYMDWTVRISCFCARLRSRAERRRCSSPTLQLTKRLPNGQEQVLAEWDNADWALTKDGKLSINSVSLRPARAERLGAKQR